MDEYELGQFGRARFSQNKKGFVTSIDAFGIIKSMDKKYILFEDNDNYQYLVNKKDFRFDKCEFKIK
jgi:hypothetical protein